jgi:hypothetical protein
VNNNDMDDEVPAVLAESSSYYLLGVESPGVVEDGRFHPIAVNVGRPGLEVRARSGYYDPTKKEREALAAASAVRNLDDAIAGVVPRGDLPMDVTVAPFAAADGKPALTVTLAITQPAERAATTERVEVLARVFNQETGKSVGSERRTIGVSWNASTAVAGQYEVLSRINVPPGRYEVRLGAKAADGRLASVYTSVDVPDFSNGPLALSGVVLSATPGPKAAPRDAFRNLMPVIPTSRRTFGPADHVTSLVRAYRRNADGGDLFATARITDTNDVIVAEDSASLALEAGRLATADYGVTLPTGTLPPGDYLLTVHIRDGDRTIDRAVRFRME